MRFVNHPYMAHKVLCVEVRATVDTLVDVRGGNETVVHHSNRMGEEDSLLGNTTAPGQRAGLMVRQPRGLNHNCLEWGTNNYIILCHCLPPSL